MPAVGQTLRKIITQSHKELLAEWVQAQLATTTLRSDLMKESELREQSRELLSLMQAGVDSGGWSRIEGSAWTGVREFLARVTNSCRAGLSSSRAPQLRLFAQATLIYPAAPPKTRQRRSRRKSTRTKECARSKPERPQPPRRSPRSSRNVAVINVKTLVRAVFRGWKVTPLAQAASKLVNTATTTSAAITQASSRQLTRFIDRLPPRRNSRKEPNRQSIPGLWTTQGSKPARVSFHSATTSANTSPPSIQANRIDAAVADFVECRIGHRFCLRREMGGKEGDHAA